MNEDLIVRLRSIIGVMNNIEVKGRQNLLNLGGAIEALEKLGQDIAVLLMEKGDKTPPEKNGGDG